MRKAKRYVDGIRHGKWCGLDEELQAEKRQKVVRGGDGRRGHLGYRHPQTPIIRRAGTFVADGSY